MAVIELVLEPVSAKQAVVAEATAAAKRDADKAAPAAEEAPEAEAVETEAAEEAAAEETATEEAVSEEAVAAEEAPEAPAAEEKDAK